MLWNVKAGSLGDERKNYPQLPLLHSGSDADADSMSSRNSRQVSGRNSSIYHVATNSRRCVSAAGSSGSGLGESGNPDSPLADLFLRNNLSNFLTTALPG